MKVMFIVQGEGRGHLTQAISMQRLLQKEGHQVVEVLVGKSNCRQLPEFFTRSIKAPIGQFYSPNFLPTAANKRCSIPRSVAYNILEAPTFVRSVLFIRNRINNSGADLVINFYELLTGITYFLFRPMVPQVSIGHQYLFLHNGFKMPWRGRWSAMCLNLFSRLTSLGAQRRLALSFYPMQDDDEHKIKVVPPLLREEVRHIEPSAGDYVHGYMLNAGFGQSVMQWHERHPEVKMYFFWDKKGAEVETKVDPTLTFHKIDDHLFLRSLAGCKGYATTAGFESVCEAMYFGKPILMIPAHIEQECNAYDAMKAGAGVKAKDFDLDALLSLMQTYKPNPAFRTWAESSSQVIIPALEQAASIVPCYPLTAAWFRMSI